MWSNYVVYFESHQRHSVVRNDGEGTLITGPFFMVEQPQRGYQGQNKKGIPLTSNLVNQ